MMSPEISKRMEALAARAESMETIANILGAQARQLKLEFAALMVCADESSTGNGAIRAPSLAEMLRVKGR
jgi:hypothetical protein